MSGNYGLILHHAVANGSLYGFFNNPSAQVSAHFWVSRSGVIEQYVDSEVTAWHAKQLNARYCGVETEGCTTSPYAEPMTPQMKDALARIYAEGNRRHGWPFALINSDGQRGFGYHRMAVNTACPCDVRVNARGDILAIAQGGTPPPTPVTRKGKDMIAATPTGKGYFTTTSDGAVYAFGDAVFKGNAMGKVTGTIVGIAASATDGYWLMASDGGVFAFGTANYYGRPDRA